MRSGFGKLLPAVAARAARAHSLVDVGGEGLGDAAKRRGDHGSAGDDVRVVSLCLCHRSASQFVVGLGDSLNDSGDADLCSHVWRGGGEHCGLGLNIVHQDCSGDDGRFGGFCNKLSVSTGSKTGSSGRLV
jgi:hypothetical protein